MAAAVLIIATFVVGALVIALLAVETRWLRSARSPQGLSFELGRTTPRYPVVLLHGVVGEPDVALGLREYFRGIAERLSRAGIAVYSPRLPAAASVAVRARELARAIERIPAERVNIIAHSMGGLDARYAISRLGIEGRVASLITVATPHHGTPLADLGAGILADRLGIAKLLAVVRVDVAAIHDLTTDRAAAFNRQVPDAECVEYGCVVATAAQEMHPLLWPTYSYLRRRVGPNDGLVPVASQRWGTVYAEVEADHWAQIGRSTTFDAPALYEKLTRELASRGL